MMKKSSPRSCSAGPRQRTVALAAVAVSGLLMITAAGCTGVNRADASPTAHAPTPGAGSASPNRTPATSSSAATSPGTTASPSAPSSSQSPSQTNVTPYPTEASTKPARGSINQVVPSHTMHTAKSVGLGNRTSSLGSGVTARVSNIRQQYVRAKLPGQLSGASVIFDLTIKNGSQKPLDLNATTVTVADSAGDPADEITATGPATTFPNLLRAGGTATATYVFIVPKGDRNPVDIDVTINADLNVVVFHGDAS